MKSPILVFIAKNALYLALLQCLAALLASLYFSEILGFTPCVLCWWQRIFIYPLIALLIVGILRRDKFVYTYVLPLAILGWCVSLYHNLLYYKIIPENLAPCTAGVSCLTKFVEYFGFLSIPLLAFLGFSVVVSLMLIYRNAVRKNAI